MQQQRGRIDHICFIFKKENLSAAMKRIGAALNIVDWDGPTEIPPMGILHVQSLEAGVEILAPLGEEGDMAAYLRERGEGFYSLVFGVADIDEALAQTMAQGVEPQRDADGKPVLIDAMSINSGNPPYSSWRTKVRTYKEIPLKPVCGLNFLLGQIEPR